MKYEQPVKLVRLTKQAYLAVNFTCLKLYLV